MESEDDALPYSYTIDMSSLDPASYSGSILTSSLTAPTWTSANTLNVTGGGSGATTYNYTTMVPPKYDSGLMVNGNAEFQGDVKIKGRSIVDTLDAIERRLSILTPNPKKLAKYEALQKAYAHYKTIEAMCDEDDDDDVK